MTMNAIIAVNPQQMQEAQVTTMGWIGHKLAAARKYAHRLAAEIKEKIRHERFVYADYFPASATATTGQGVTTGDRLGI